MSLLLDTNICSVYIKRPTLLSHRFTQHGGQLYLPTIVVGELYTWAHRSDHPEHLAQLIDEEIVRLCGVLDFDISCAITYARVRSQMLDQGKPASPADLMIAATALAHDMTVVTANVKHFSVVPNLRYVNWLD